MENGNLNGNDKNGMEAIAGFNEGERYLDIYRAIYPLITPDGILIDMGHGKNLQFPVRVAQTIAKHFPNKEMVYYDSSDPEVIRGWFDSLKSQIRRKSRKKTEELVDKARQVARDIPDVIKWVDSPKEYIGKASEVSFFFTRHHFKNPRDALKEAYDLLRPEENGNVNKPGGVVVVVDYDLKRKIEGMSREQAEVYVGSRFTTSSELEVRRTEPDWFEAHTREGLAECVRDMTEIGFNVIEREVYDDKVYSCVGRKTGEYKEIKL